MKLGVVRDRLKMRIEGERAPRVEAAILVEERFIAHPQPKRKTAKIKTQARRVFIKV